MSQAKRKAQLDGDDQTQLGNSDGMGTPASKTMLRENDQAWSETNIGGTGEGNTTKTNTYDFDAAMTFGSVTSSADSAQRATIDHQYRSVHGHFLDATTESVLQFKEGVAGTDATFSLTSPSGAAASLAFGDPQAPAPGSTYSISQNGSAFLTNTSAGESQVAGTQISSEPSLSTTVARDATLWTVLDTGRGDGSFSLVNRSDGMCLAHDGQAVTVDTCIDDVTRHWLQTTTGQGQDMATQLFPTASDESSSVGSDGGQGVPDTLGANTTQTWQFSPVTTLSAGVPSWSAYRTGGFTPGNIAAPYSMAVGDLDGAATSDAQAGTAAFHDEAVVVFTDSDDNWALRVVDYNANPSHLLVTAPDPSLSFGKNGRTINGTWNPGDLIVEVGDFDGDSHNEILTAFQDNNGNFQPAFWRYVANQDGTRTLQRVSEGVSATPLANPVPGNAQTTLQQGYADSAVGDFDGDGSDDFALAYASQADQSSTSPRTANLVVWTLNKFDPDIVLSARSIKGRSIEATRPAMPTGNLPFALTGDASRTSAGIRLKAGYFRAVPENGFGPNRSSLAIAWVGETRQEAQDNWNDDGNVFPFQVAPTFALYTAETGDCNSAGTTCETDVDVAIDPQELFDQGSTLAYRVADTYDPAPLALDAGSYGGTGENDPPVWGIVATGWLESGNNSGASNTYYAEQNVIVPWTDDDPTKWTSTKTNQSSKDANPILTRYTAFDQTGSALVLGAPAVLNIEQNVKEQIVAAAPPSHVDWLNGGWVNVSANDGLSLVTKVDKNESFSSQTTRKNTWQNTFTQGTDVKATYATGIPDIASASGNLEINQKFQKDWSGLTETSTSDNSTWKTDAQATTSFDDAFTYSADDTRLTRYPILGKAGQTSEPDDCSDGCRAYYDVYSPTGSVLFPNVPGKTTSLFSPSWENLNALSYPTVNADDKEPPVTLLDAGSYSYLDSGTPTTSSAALYNSVNTIGSNASSVTLDFSEQAGASSTITHDRTWTVGADVAVSGKVTVGDPEVDGLSVEAKESAGFDVSKATGSAVTGSDNTTSGGEFELNIPKGLPSAGYRIGTAFYYSTDGAAKVVHAVDLTSSNQGKDWWEKTYDTPDPALNLPGRIDLVEDTTVYKTIDPIWLTAPQRQLIRGFQSLQGSDDATGLPTKNDPYTINPSAQQPVVFQVPVHNYSLKAMVDSTTLAWWAVPVDDEDLAVTGDPISLGSSEVPAIDAQGTTNVKSQAWTALAAANNQHQQYRIVVQIDPDGTAPDLHPLNGDVCPTDKLQPANNTTPVLTDVMKQGDVAETLGCGQNNQGYGLVTVDPAQSASTGVGASARATVSKPAGAKLDGGSISTGGDLLRLTDRSDVPTVPVNQATVGVVHASANLSTGDHPLIAVYDGPVADGKVVAVTTMAGIDAQAGGSARFSWTPTTSGVHELHQVLLGTRTTGEDDEQIMRVNVAPALDQYQLTATAEKRLVSPGGTFSIAGKITPVPGRSDEREVRLQQLVRGQWTVIDRDQMSGKGRVNFDLTAGKPGEYEYRLYKTATAGRRGAVSKAVSITVGAPFALTARARPTVVKPGHAVKILGTLSPPPSKAQNREVKLQRFASGRWRTVATTRSTPSGQYFFKVRMKKKGRYEYRVYKAAVAPRPSAMSKTLKVKVT